MSHKNNAQGQEDVSPSKYFALRVQKDMYQNKQYRHQKKKRGMQLHTETHHDTHQRVVPEEIFFAGMQKDLL